MHARQLLHSAARNFEQGSNDCLLDCCLVVLIALKLEVFCLDLPERLGGVKSGIAVFGLDLSEGPAFPLFLTVNVSLSILDGTLGTVAVVIRVEHVQFLGLRHEIEDLENVLADELIFSCHIEDQGLLAAVGVDCLLGNLQGRQVLFVFNVDVPFLGDPVEVQVLP
jgi:hypothetical protein